MAENVADPYLDWPYAPGYVLRTLDPKLIENHASAILSRALNLGRVVAFLGAGTSMAYGRISWKSLVVAERDDVVKEYEESKDKNLQDDLHVKRLYQTVKRIDLDRDDVRADRYPMMFQACEQLGKAIAEWRQRNGKDSTSPRDDAKSRAMERTVDDLGHAERIISTALADVMKHLEAGEALKSHDIVADTREYLRAGTNGWNEAILNLYSTRFLSQLLKKARAYPAAGPLIQAIKANVPSGDDARCSLGPIHRYLVGALLRALPPRTIEHQLRTLIAKEPEKKRPPSALSQPSATRCFENGRTPCCCSIKDWRLPDF